MTDDAYFQDEDQLSEGNLGKALLADNNKDYFDRGGGITGPTSGEVTVEAAQAFIEDTSSEQLYKVYPTAETLVLPVASGNNYVYATFDPATQDSATWEVTDTQGSGLSNPVSLLRAVVDTSAGSVDLRNGDPVGSFESVSAGELSNVADIVIQDSDDPQTRINEANPGDTIVSHSQTQFTLSSPLEVTTDGLTVWGLNLKTGNGMDDVALFTHSCKDVTLEKCRIDGNKTNNSETTALTVNGITVTDAENITIQNCHIKDTVSQGIVATSYTEDTNKTQGPVEDVFIVNNRVTGADNGGILFAGGGSNTSRGGYAAGNVVLNAANEQLQVIDGFDGVTLEGNYLAGDSPGIAIENHALDRNSTDTTGVNILGNTIKVSANGIILEKNNLDQDGIQILGNTIELTTTSVRGVLCDAYTADYISIVGNHFKGASGAGTDGVVGVRFNNPNTNSITVGFNTFDQFARGVYFDNADTVDATVVGNSIYDTHIGIRFRDSGGCNASHNIIKSVRDTGIQIAETNGTNIDGNKAIGNHIVEAGGGGADAIETLSSNGSLDNYIIKNNTSSGMANGVSDSAAGGTTFVTDNIAY